MLRSRDGCNELDSRVAVVHRCSSESGDSILSAPRTYRRNVASKDHVCALSIFVGVANLVPTF